MKNIDNDETTIELSDLASIVKKILLRLEPGIINLDDLEFKEENDKLKAENKKLRLKNKKLNKENKDLKKENKEFKEHYDRFDILDFDDDPLKEK